MTFVITGRCCNDGSCVSVCPVQCIRPRPGDPDFMSAEQLYIDPDTCIDCGACMDECPIDAVHADYDLDPDDIFMTINAEYFANDPIEESELPPSTRRRLPEGVDTLRVAVVGSGPAASYATGLLTDVKGVSVSVFEKLPTPFGLTRAGVAPDHQQTKLITERFKSYLSRAAVDCFFNVEVGRDVSLGELEQSHDAVIWAGGASGSRTLGIPGEDLPGVHSATQFVAWYNGHPGAAAHTFDLSGRRAIVIGNGNVAIDVARILATPAESLTTTDMADRALTVLSGSTIDEVQVVARRGPGSSAFTMAELLALEHMPSIDLLAIGDEVDAGDDHVFMRRGSDATLARRMTVLREAAARQPVEGRRNVMLRYLHAPVSINGAQRVESVTFERQRIAVHDGVAVLEPTGDLHTVDADLVLYAVGYRGAKVADLPFDPESGTIPNDAGRVVDPETGQPATGLYCAGWIKRGPSGVIGSNKECAAETVDSLLADLAAGRLQRPVAEFADLQSAIEQRTERVDFAGWNRINQAERQRGRDARRPRVKFISVDEMLEASRG